MYDFSPKSDQLIASHIAQAKAALGINSKAKNMPVDMKRAIWQWHYDMVNALRTIHRQANDDSDVLSNEKKPVNKGGRPRKHNSDADRMKAYRRVQKLDGCKAMLTRKHQQPLLYHGAFQALELQPV